MTLPTSAAIGVTMLGVALGAVPALSHHSGAMFEPRGS